MKMIYTSRNQSEVGLLKTILEQEGIRCNFRNDAIHLSMPYMLPEVWVVNEADYAKAEALVASFQSDPEDEQDAWICKTCGETNEGQFGECWHCGSTP